MGHQNSTMAARFILVSSALALCAVVALFALAADQYEDISTSELASKDAVVALKAMLAKQAAMDKQEQALFATLSSKQKAAVHKAAAAKKAKEKKVEQHKTAKAKHLSWVAKIEHNESVMTTGKEFEKFHGTKANKMDKKIAMQAGLNDLGDFGSKNYIDSKLKALHCDPTNFMCTGTKAEKKQALKLIEQIQQSITGDAKKVKAYAWKQEHALPPAPKM